MEVHLKFYFNIKKKHFEEEGGGGIFKENTPAQFSSYLPKQILYNLVHGP